jgi:hypothetical protein
MSRRSIFNKVGIAVIAAALIAPVSTTQSHAATGDINITGKGATTGTGLGYGNGIELYNGSSITSTGTGNITLNGTAGGTSADGNYGVFSVAGNNIIGGASDKGNVTINSNDAAKLNDITVQTGKNIKFNLPGTLAVTNGTIKAGGDVTIDPTDVALANTKVSGTNVTIDPAHDVILTGGSTIAADTTTGTLSINNSGKFSSDTAGVLSGNVVNLNQSQAGSIQNAIDAVGTHSTSAKLTLGTGTWTELVNLAKSLFTLTGQGAGSVVKATANGTTVVNVTGSNDTISNLAVDANGKSGVTGILFNSASGNITGTTVTNGATGIGLSNSTVKVSGNTVTDNSTGISLGGSDNSSITGNTIKGGTFGVSANTSNNLTINNNVPISSC